MICPRCQTANPESARFCMNCGTGLGNAGSTPPRASTVFSLESYIPRELIGKLESARARGGMLGERRIITILFCDIKGSTAAAEGLDPEEWTEIINAAFERMIRPIYDYEGIVPRLMGDAILAFFGAPIAHEDDPQRAVQAALDIQASLAPYGRQIQEKFGVEFKVRVGINTGLVVVGEIGSDLRLEYTAIGDAINLAARMEQTAEPGTIQISEETYKLVAPFFEIDPLGESQIKGKATPVRTYRVRSVKKMPGQLRGLQGLSSPLVGRAPELSSLERRLQNLDQGSGFFLAVTGEAGLGKTSLVAEARRRMGESARVEWLEGHALSYAQSSSYFVWRQVIRQSIRANEEDATDIVRAQLNAAYSQSDLSGIDLAFLEVMLAVESEKSQKEVSVYQGEAFLQRMNEAMHKYISDLCRKRPLVIVLDDLHWMDAASVSLLYNLADLVQGTALLFIGLSRPEGEASGWKLISEIHQKLGDSFSQLALEPLPEDESDALLGNLLGQSELPREFIRWITYKTDGNPFFVEELIRSLIEVKQIVRENSHWKISGEFDKVSIPTTLTGVLGARIDRLPDETKHILQIASVIGRSFDLQVLTATIGSGSELEPHIHRLEQAKLIQPIQDNREAYIFHHALVQEAAYESILLKQRHSLHLKIGTILEDLFASRVEEFATVLAYHFRSAQDARSLKYDTLAGDSAARLYANAEASTHYAHALAAAKQFNAEARQVLDLYSKYGGSLEQCGHYDQALSNYKEMQSFAYEHGDQKMEISALMAQATVYSTYTATHNPALAEKMNLQALELARQLGDLDTQVKLRWNLMLTYLFSKRVKQAAEQGELALSLAHSSQNLEQLAFVLNDLARVRTCLGQFEQAFTTAQEARELWRKLDNQPMLADGLGAEAEARFAAGQAGKAIELLGEALQINKSIENLWGQSYVHVLLNLVHTDLGNLDLAIQAADEAITLGDQTGLLASSIGVRCELAWAYGCVGAADKGLEIARRALSIAEAKQPEWITFPKAILVRLSLLRGEIREAQAFAGQAILEPIPIPYPHFTILIRLANAELALANRDFAKGKSLSDELVNEVSGLTRPGVPEALYTKAQALVGLGCLKDAYEILAQARSMAASLGSKQILWPILYLMAKIEAERGHSKETKALRAEADQIVTGIADRLGALGLRRPFLEQAKSRE